MQSISRLNFGEEYIKLIYLNLLWILFTFSGFIIFGLIPSTVVMFKVLRDDCYFATNLSFKEYFLKYKKEYFLNYRENFIQGTLIFTPTFLLFIEYILYFQNEVNRPIIYKLSFIGSSIWALLFFVYGMLVCVHFKKTTKDLFLCTVQLIMTNFKENIFLLASFVFGSLITIILPVFLFPIIMTFQSKICCLIILKKFDETVRKNNI